MRYDFSSVHDTDTFASVPEGRYRCRVAEVRERSARDGSPMWSFRLEVLDGEWAGRTAAWDSITWSERGIFRVKQVLGAFGCDVSGELEVGPLDLVDMRAQVDVEREEREDPLSGRRQIRNRVPYLGYASAEEGPEADELSPAPGAPGANGAPGAHGANGTDEAPPVGPDGGPGPRPVAHGHELRATGSDDGAPSARGPRRVDPEATAPVDGWGGEDE